jgi:hypothetical protein
MLGSDDNSAAASGLRHVATTLKLGRPDKILANWNKFEMCTGVAAGPI